MIRSPKIQIQRIRALLSTKVAVATRSLSKRWQTSWTSVPVIDLSDLPPGADDNLDRNTAPTVSKFVFRSPDHAPFRQDVDESRIDRWMRFVERKRVKEVELELTSIYTLPQFLYENPCFEKLNLRKVELEPEGRINWPSLKTLYLRGSALDGDLFHNILSGCPSLEVLKLSFIYRGDSGFNFLDFRSCSRLRKLVIDCDENNDELQILAPTLESLEIIGDYKEHQKFQIINSPSLTHAKLDFYAGFIYHGMPYVNMTTQLLQSLNHVRDFSIGNWYIQILSEGVKWQSFRCPHSTRKRLILETCLNEWTLPGITYLLESSPEVETIVINTLPLYREECEIHYRKLHKQKISHYLKCGAKFLQHVKMVEIVGFQNYDLELRFIEFLLANTPVLDRMIIHGEEEHFKPYELLGISRRLSSFRKCSPSAVIIGSLFKCTM